MAIAKLPHRKPVDSADRAVEAFISGAGKDAEKSVDAVKKPTMIRIDPDLLERFDRAAKRLGISRSAFLCSAGAEKLERMDG